MVASMPLGTVRSLELVSARAWLRGAGRSDQVIASTSVNLYLTPAFPPCGRSTTRSTARGGGLGIEPPASRCHGQNACAQPSLK